MQGYPELQKGCRFNQ